MRMLKKSDLKKIKFAGMRNISNGFKNRQAVGLALSLIVIAAIALAVFWPSHKSAQISNEASINAPQDVCSAANTITYSC